jgi:hypothetical protein
MFMGFLFLIKNIINIAIDYIIVNDVNSNR